MSAVTVEADDIVAVAAIWDIFIAPNVPPVATLPAAAAMERLKAAIANTAMPEDPVTGPGEAAAIHHEIMTVYQNAEFTREEAFAVVLTYIQANATARALQGGFGGH